jgi:hypothetical protein
MQANAAITLVEAISTVWAAIRTRHPDTPDVFVTVGAGVSARGVKLGHFAAGSWLHHSAAEGAEAMAELFVGGEGLASGPADLLATLLHEAAHGIAHTRGVKDTSRQGRWHNARFRDIAQGIGLTITRNDRIGWSVSDLGPTTAENYAAELRILSDALVAHRVTTAGGDDDAKTKRTSFSASCGCGRTIRLSRKTFDLGPITCSVCGDAFLVRH